MTYVYVVTAYPSGSFSLDVLTQTDANSRAHVNECGTVTCVTAASSTEEMTDVWPGLNVRHYREQINEGTVVHLLHVPRLDGLAQMLTFWHRSFTFNSNKSPTWSDIFSVYYPEVCLQLNMFRAFSLPSSGAQWLQWQPLVLPSYRGDSRAVLTPTTCFGHRLCHVVTPLTRTPEMVSLRHTLCRMKCIVFFHRPSSISAWHGERIFSDLTEI
jgi:hypothetical protein